jgi:hypothetical protein
MKKTCEVTFSKRQRGGEKGWETVWTECGKPAAFIWTPRSNPKASMPVCADCGPQLAGNFTDELTPIKP